MYYYDCKLNDEPVILYHSKELKDEDFKNLKVTEAKEVTREGLELEPICLHPLLSYNDLILRAFKKRTPTHKLGELNINSYRELSGEYSLVQQKKSRLSRSERELVVNVYESLQL